MLARRARLKRALLATLLLAQGTPMLAAGDEIGHSQRGNNNPYCQDNEITWLDWDAADQDLTDFVARLIGLRKRLLPLGPTWYNGRVDARGRHDLAWLRRTGEPMTVEQWHNRGSRVLGALIGAPGRGDERLLLLFNARDSDVAFELPPGNWVAEFDSSTAEGRSRWRRDATAPPAPTCLLAARSVMLLRDDATEP